MKQRASASWLVSRVLSFVETKRRSFLWPRGCPSGQAAYPGVVADRTGPAPIFGLAPGGVCRASLSPGCWWALTLRDLRPPTVSPLPSQESGVRRQCSGSELEVGFLTSVELTPDP